MYVKILLIIFFQLVTKINFASRDQISVKVRVRLLIYFTKYIPENLKNTTENDKERLSNSFE